MTKENLTKPVALTCDNIGELDCGIARHLIDAEIQKAIDDLSDRGEEDGKERIVAINVTLGIHKGIIYTNVAAQAKLPPRRSKSTAGKVRMKGKGQHEMLFMPTNPDSADQPTFDYPEDEPQ